MASDITSYNVQGYIHKLENLEEYEFPFERLRRVEEEFKDNKGSEEEKKIEEVNEEDEEDKEGEEIDSAKDMVKKLQTPSRTLDLNEIEEEKADTSTQATESQ